MTLERTILMLCFAIAVSACETTPPARDVANTSQPRDLPNAPLYPLLSEEELAAATARADGKVDGWSVTLDPLGFLSMATCTACEKTKPFETALSADDREHIEQFLREEDGVLATRGPFVIRRSDTAAGGIFFQQNTPAGVAGYFRAQRAGGQVMIGAHAWPRLPPIEKSKGDAELEPILRKMDPDPDLTLARSIRPIARSLSGPVELHLLVCLSSLTDTMPRAPTDPPPPKRPCVDAITGEDLTGLTVGWTVRTVNGHVTKRELKR